LIPKETAPVADLALVARTGFAGAAIPGRYGRVVGGERPVMLAERCILTITQISAYRDKMGEIAKAVLDLSGLELPQRPERVAANGVALIGMARGQWLAVAEGDKGRAVLARLNEVLSDLAAIGDQSDAKAMLRLAGSRARDVLAKGCALDLDEGAFKPQDAATTQIALIPCQLWQLDEGPTYELAVPLSYARSFWSWLTASAAEYGYEVRPPLSSG
jgi:methylglutamate dehydrogenase subunit D